tara:strand:+ start:1092 stop:1241 length:150 start_codon:yes stop_codon:yes gene_type:complete
MKRNPKKIEWHPNTSQVYKEKIANLTEALHAELEDLKLATTARQSCFQG